MVNNSQNYANITVKVTDETKKRLDQIKIIPEETMNNVIKRVLDFYMERKD